MNRLSAGMAPDCNPHYEKLTSSAGYSGCVRALVLAVLCALIAAGCGSEKADEAAPPPTETTTAADRAKRPAAPAIEGESLDGERISLADYRGRAVFVNAWSSW
jgi:hypothetical protein